MSYFSGFPFVVYKFGTESALTSFQDITAYVEVIDSIKDNVSFYTNIQITANERPDTLSQKLYGTPSLYWTFFFMNDRLRESGWPLNQQELDQFIRKTYPLQTIITRDSLEGIFLPGQIVGGVTSGATARVISRRIDFGQINVKMLTGKFINGELMSSTVADVTQSIANVAVVDQFNATHSWQDSDGLDVDVDPTVGTTGFDTPTTFYERMTAQNDELRTIRIIKPSAVGAVRSAFKDALVR